MHAFASNEMGISTHEIRVKSVPRCQSEGNARFRFRFQRNRNVNVRTKHFMV